LTAPHVSVADDRRSVVVRRETDQGIITTRYGWAAPITDEQLALATTDATDDDHMVVGQHSYHRAFRSRFGTLIVGTESGPPTWWLPRVHVRRWAVQIGWLRFAVDAAWSRGSD
jgi:hypothetical protein